MDPAGPDWPDPIPWPSVSTLCAAVDPAPRVPASGTGTQGLQTPQTLQTLIRSPGVRGRPAGCRGTGNCLWKTHLIGLGKLERPQSCPHANHAYSDPPPDASRHPAIATASSS